MVAVANLLELNGKQGMDKAKALESALAQIERQFGKGSIMKLGQDNAVMDIEATSTGSLGLDIALGIGGLPQGRIVEIYGPESSGKTTLTLHVVAESQKKGGVCAFVDAEHALDPQYAKKLGVNLDELLISQPDTGEQALEIVDTLVRSGAVNLIVVDSVAALVPKAEHEGEMGMATMGMQARLMPNDGHALPTELPDALTALQGSTLLRQALGPRLCDLFAGIKRHEHTERAGCADARRDWDLRYLIELA
jgi:recombination protein RecA